MKEKMLLKLERDRLQGKNKTLEETIRNMTSNAGGAGAIGSPEGTRGQKSPARLEKGKVRRAQGKSPKPEPRRQRTLLFRRRMRRIRIDLWSLTHAVWSPSTFEDVQGPLESGRGSRLSP